MEIYLWHTLFVNTLLTFIYLSNFPEDELKRKVLYIVKWTALFIFIEIVLLKMNHIHHYNGWNLVWTTLFDLVMFSMLRLHYKKPLWTIVLSIPVTLFYLIVFDYI
jgi:hypothetical protein